MKEILIVDDLENNRRIIRLQLEHRGFTVAEEATEDSAWRALEGRLAPSAVILDLNLGSESGLNILRRLRADPVFQALPVVFASAAADRTAVMESMRLGIVQFLAKPIDSTRLRDAVDRSVERNWMQVHFADATRLCLERDLDLTAYRRMVDLFFSDLARVVAERMRDSMSVTDATTEISALEQTARDLGLLVLQAPLAEWKQNVGAPPPPIAQRGRVLGRLFQAFTGAR